MLLHGVYGHRFNGERKKKLPYTLRKTRLNNNDNTNSTIITTTNINNNNIIVITSCAWRFRALLVTDDSVEGRWRRDEC